MMESSILVRARMVPEVPIADASVAGRDAARTQLITPTMGTSNSL
jgi:hypothetical protein